MRLRLLLYPVAALAFSGCNLLRGKCDYELRSLEADGVASSGGTELATATMALSEERGSIQGQSLFWLITGSLKGHVLRASFKDGADLSRVLLDLPIAPAERTEISQGTAASAAGDAIAGFHDILVAGRGVIELQTDLSDTPTVQIAMPATSSGDWIRPYCS
jgi:hypothetical protein